MKIESLPRIASACVASVVLASAALASDLELAALDVISGGLGSPPWREYVNGDMIPVARFGVTLADVRAITNRADVLALYAERQAAESAPHIEPLGIELPVIVLQSVTNDYGIGVIASDDGALLTYVDHQSPRPPQAVIDARIAEALAERRAGVESARINRAAAIPAAAAANSIPALREAVRLLQAQVDALMALQGINTDE